MSAAPRPAVFLDRDGTLVRDVDFLCDPDRLELLPAVPGALRRLSAAGFLLVVVTNQSAVARGLIDEPRLKLIHDRLRQRLAEHDVRLAHVDWCPHHPEVGRAPWRTVCDCRKPAPGMIQRSIARLGIDPRASWTVGDAERDLLAGRASAIPGILVGTGRGALERSRMTAAGRPPERYADDLEAAADLILASGRGQPPSV